MILDIFNNYRGYHSYQNYECCDNTVVREQKIKWGFTPMDQSAHPSIHPSIHQDYQNYRGNQKLCCLDIFNSYRTEVTSVTNITKISYNFFKQTSWHVSSHYWNGDIYDLVFQWQFGDSFCGATSLCKTALQFKEAH